MSHHLILHRFARTDEKADIHVVRRSRLVAGAPTTSPLSRKPPCSGGAGWRGVSPSLDARTDRARRRVTVNLRDACRRRCPALKRSAFAPLQVLVSEHSLSSVNRSVGIHGQPWPKVSRPVRPQRARQLKSPEPPARGSSRRPGHWHRCRSDRWSGVVRIRPRGPLDRVAQIVKRKYCRPHARPFRLGLTRVL